MKSPFGESAGVAENEPGSVIRVNFIRDGSGGATVPGREDLQAITPISPESAAAVSKKAVRHLREAKAGATFGVGVGADNSIWGW